MIQEYERQGTTIKDLRKELYEKNKYERNNSSTLELEITKQGLHELETERREYATIIKEQTRQIEEYREKFLRAQQTVEEQKREMEGMEADNAKIEEQVNLEIQRIKCKFQEKMRELTPLPKMLENEQLKLHETIKKNKALEKKLMDTVAELSQKEALIKEYECKYNEANVMVIADLHERINKLTAAIEKLQHEYNRVECEAKEQREKYECLRAETARIIARANERSEATHSMQCERIMQLEKQLAKARADATCDLKEREETLKIMEKKMKTLANNFDDAQCQIHQLKNHVSILTKPERKCGTAN